MHHNQVEYMPEMQIWFNIYNSINVIHLIFRLKIIFLTFEKIQHPFLIKVFSKLEIKGKPQSDKGHLKQKQLTYL